MQFFTQETALSCRPDYASINHTQRSVYHLLLLYCAVEENAGRISGARNWPDHYWQAIAKIEGAFMFEPCGVWWWEGDDLLIKYYPLEQEERLRTQRFTLQLANINKARKKLGLPLFKWEANAVIDIPGAVIETSVTAGETAVTANSSAAPVKLGNVREGKVKEGNAGRGAVAPQNGSAVAAAALPSYFPKSAEQAIELSPDHDPELVRNEWVAAAARNGRDFKMRPIRNWPHYMQSQKAFRDNKPVEKSAAAPAWQIKALEIELADIKTKLENQPRVNEADYPEEFKKIQERFAPLRARQLELKAQIKALQQS